MLQATLGPDTEGARFSVDASGRDRIVVRGVAEQKTTFARVLGQNDVEITVQSTASPGGGEADIYFLLDLSASMGIGADAVERARLQALTKPYTDLDPAMSSHSPNGCQFACHQREGWEPGSQTSYEMAKAAGIRLREDDLLESVRRAGLVLLDPARPAVAAGKARVGVVGFASETFMLAPPSSNRGDLQAGIDAHLSIMPSSKRTFTLQQVAMPWIKREMAANIVDERRPRKLVLITDGVKSLDASRSGWEEFDAAACDDIKADGTEIYVIEVRYEEERGDPLFEMMVAPFYERITPALRRCASSSNHLLTTSPTEVEAAFLDIAKRLGAGTVRLTN